MKKGCHPERSEGSQPEPQPRLIRRHPVAAIGSQIAVFSQTAWRELNPSHEPATTKQKRPPTPRSLSTFNFRLSTLFRPFPPPSAKHTPPPPTPPSAPATPCQQDESPAAPPDRA